MSVRRHLAWMSLSQGLFFVFQFAGSVALAHLLNPHQMGIFAAATALYGVLSTIQAFGLSGFIVRERNIHHDLTASAFTINCIISLILAALVAGVSTSAGYFMKEQGVRNVMLLLALTPILGIFEFLPAASMERDAEFKAIALITTGRTVITQVLTIGTALMGCGYMSMAYGQIGAATLGALAYNIAGRQHASFRLNISDWRRVTKFGLDMLAISGANTIAARISEFLLGRIVGIDALGLYFRASNLNNIAWGNINIVMGRVLFVELASEKKHGLSLRKTYMEIVDTLTAILWPAFAGLAIVAGPFILAIYGSAWVAAAHPLVMLALASIVLVSITMTWEVFVVSNETSTQVKIEFVRTGFGLALFILGCFVSLTAAAAARLAEAVASILLYRPHLDRMTDTRTNDFIGIYFRNSMLTIAAIAPAAVVMAIYHGSEHAPLNLVSFGIVTGMLIWLALIFALKHPVYYEIKKLMRLLPLPLVRRGDEATS